MDKKLFFFILILFCANKTFAQQTYGSYVDYGSNFANGIYTDTRYFNGSPLGSSDVTVQVSLQTLNNFLTTSNLVTTLCNQSKINCIYDESSDCPNSDRCFVYEDSMMKLYANGSLQAQWPSVAIFDKLLLEGGDFVLLETGDKILLE